MRLNSSIHLTAMAALILLCAAGCGGGIEASPSPEPVARVDRRGQGTGADDAEADPEGAIAAYRLQSEAFARGDADVYFGAFDNRLRCFYGRMDATRDTVRAQRAELVARNVGAEEPTRIETLATRVARVEGREVELIDYGWMGRGALDEHTVFHAKRVLLAQQADGGWRVVAEGKVTDDSCELPALEPSPPPLWTYMRDRFRMIIQRCVGPEGANRADGYAGIGGSNGCMMSGNFLEAERYCEARSDEPVEACIHTTRAAYLAFFGYEHPSP